MSTLIAKHPTQVSAHAVRFSGERLLVQLSDGRELAVPFKKIPWLKWLVKATPRQRADWSIEPGGFAIYWNRLDDGIEVCHLLASENLTGK